MLIGGIGETSVTGHDPHRPHSGTIDFSSNTQSWQCCHFCTTSNENILEVFANEINFTKNVHSSALNVN